MKRTRILHGFLSRKAMLRTFISIALCLPLLSATAQEQVFAEYFDIPVGSPEGTEVTGRIHLERNKDVHTKPIPKDYCFEIVQQPEEKLFRLDTRYDLSNRIMGVLTVDKGKSTPVKPTQYRMTVALKNGNKQMKKFKVNVRIVKKTLWNQFYERYTPTTLKNRRMYGYKRPTDKEVADLITQVEQNEGRFEGFRSYTTKPQNFGGNPHAEGNDSYHGSTIEYDWTSIANLIGQMGYAYATSKVYGPKGSAKKREQLKNAIYKAILTYTKSVPIEGDEVLINGKPIGNCTGDGFSLLESHDWAGHQISTHQWTMTDPLVVPVLHLMPELLKGMQAGDKTCLEVHDALVRYFQVFMSIVKSRRAIDNPNERWGEIQDTLYSSGAWADANLGHRSRTMLALPIIWADYNRPMTYVQYWYKDFYNDKPFKGFSFQPSWSPHGVVADVSHWMTKFNIPTHHYAQSGFQPDGTISHHVGRGTDAAMVAYGFGWLTECTPGYAYFKDTPYKIADKYYQFQENYLLDIYPKLFYKQQMDFLVAGRSFHEDMNKFVTETYTNAIHNLLKARSRSTKLNRIDELKAISQILKENTYEYSGTDAYWVNEFLVHRRGTEEPAFYASLKLKSERTVGAEDFNKKVRRSWHMGYGILPVKVDGDEYSDKVLKNFDWHALPGLTEEWRTDPLPTKGGSQASLPGKNRIAGVLADGWTGMGIYHHLPKETYSATTAYKTYHFIEDRIIAMGSGVARLRKGQQKDIVTFIDQSALKGRLTWCIGEGKNESISADESKDLALPLNNEVCWLHHGQKGYVILPTDNAQLLIKTGEAINTTDRKVSDGKPNYIIALNHGSNPGKQWSDKYCYIELPNVTAKEMPQRVKEVLASLKYKQESQSVHAVYDADYGIYQYAFFRPDSISVGGITAVSKDVTQIMLRDNGQGWTLSVSNPMPDGKKQRLCFTLSINLTPGIYTYTTGGIYPLEGETVTITPCAQGSQVVVELPDIRDEKRYNYQTDLYAATPIVIDIPANSYHN